MAEEFNGLEELQAALADAARVRKMSEERSDILFSTLDTLNTAELTSAAAAQEVATSIGTNIEEQGALAEKVAAADANISYAEFDNVLDAQDLIYQTSEATATRLATLRDAGDQELEGLLANLNIVQETEALGMLDFVKNPIETIKATYTGKQAKDQIPTQVAKIDAINAAQRMHSATWQAEVDTLKQRAEAKQAVNRGLYFTRMELQNQVSVLNAEKGMNDAMLQNWQTQLGFTNTSMQNIRGQLAAELQRGDLSQRAVNSIIQTEQLRVSQEQIGYALRLAKNNEAARESMNARLLEANGIFGTNYANIEEFDMALRNKTVAPERAYAMQQYMTYGALGAAQTFNSTDPYKAFQTAVAIEGQTWISPELQAIVANNVRPILMNSRLTDEAKDTQIRVIMASIYQDSRSDIDNLLSKATNVIDIVNPSKVDYESWDTTIPLPAAAVDIMKTLNINSTTFGDFATDAIRKVGADSTVDLETAAKGLAAMSQYQLKATNTVTGFGLQRVNTPALGAGTELAGDATNPAHWLRKLQLERARLTRLNEAFSTSRTGQYLLP